MSFNYLNALEYSFTGTSVLKSLNYLVEMSHVVSCSVYNKDLFWGGHLVMSFWLVSVIKKQYKLRRFSGIVLFSHFFVNAMHNGFYCLVSDERLFATYYDALCSSLSPQLPDDSYCTLGHYYKTSESLFSALYGEEGVISNSQSLHKEAAHFIIPPTPKKKTRAQRI